MYYPYDIAVPVVSFRSRSGHFLLRNSCQLEQNLGSIRRTNYAESFRPFSKFGLVLFVKDFISFLYVLYSGYTVTICVIRRIILSDGPHTTYVLLNRSVCGPW